jgi:isovaleryl-CoA dehydrogenase
MWITNGIIDDNNTPCDIVYLYAKMKNKNVISTFLIEKNAPGFYSGQKIKNKLGMRGSPTAEIIFDNCIISKENIVSEHSSVKNMMRNLQVERLALAAISIGIAKHSLDIMIKYANERKAFGKIINNFGQIQQYIADSYSEYMACKTYLYNIAYKINISNYNLRIECDSIKLIAAKMAKNVSDKAIQILGGNGYIGEFNIERFWRDAKLIEIGGGTNEILQKNITKDLSKFNKVL